MSSSIPPQGPSSDGPDYLSTGGGAPAPERGGGGRRGLLVGGVAVAVAGLVGGGAWAVTSFLGAGAQPSEALPSTTLGYASIDLDPSGQQKVEALRTLRKFPEFRESVGLETDDDVRRYVFEQTLGQAECDGLDYDDDVEPWLGDRAALAAVPGSGDRADAPSPVVVLQVTDPGAADEGLAALRACAGGDDELAWVVDGDWAVLAPTEGAAQAVVDAADEDSLADDADFGRWSEEVGDAGVVSMYAAPAVGPLLLEQIESARSQGGDELDGLPSGDPLDDLAEGFGLGLAGGEVPEELRTQLESFAGAAGTLRFEDGGVEFAFASGGGEDALARWSEEGAEAVRSLPADTAAALGFGLPDGWAADYVDSLEAGVGGLAEGFLGTSFDELVSQAEAASGLEIPEDVETLLGDSVALAVGGDLDLEVAEQSQDGSEVPVGLKVIGDGEEITRVLDKLDEAFGLGTFVGDDAEGDAVAIGPSADYREQLLEDGGLGETEAFTDVVPEPEDAVGVLFVDFDADWLTQLAETEGDDEVLRNLEPLSAVGFSAWADDDVAHVSLRVATG